jgi:PDZ domain-containing secreted protein
MEEREYFEGVLIIWLLLRFVIYVVFYLRSPGGEGPLEILEGESAENRV